MGRILIACHDPAVRRMLCSNLIQDGHNLWQSKDAQDARHRISVDDYDCIFLTPEVSDDDVLKSIAAALPATDATSVIVLVPGQSLGDVVNGLGSAVFQAFAEPFLPALMRTAAQRACERSSLVRENGLLRTAISRIEDQLKTVSPRSSNHASAHAEVAAEPLPAVPAFTEQNQDRGNGNNVDRNNVAGVATDFFNLNAVLDKIEKALIERTLSDAGGLQAEAARRMGLSRSALAYKLHKDGIRI